MQHTLTVLRKIHQNLLQFTEHKAKDGEVGDVQAESREARASPALCRSRAVFTHTHYLDLWCAHLLSIR